MSIRSKRLKHPDMTPDQIEAIGKVPQEELHAIGESIRSALAEAKVRAAEAEREAERRQLPPLTKRGGKSSEEPSPVKLVLEDGVVKIVPPRRGWGGSAAFVDWLNFTCHESTFQIGQEYFTNKDVMIVVSMQLEQLFGFGITAARETGANFYQRSYILGDGYGMVCHGGQRNTLLVMLNGEGCTAAKPGWEGRVKEFLEQSTNGRITRIDLAHDIHDGLAYDVTTAARDFDDGLFNSGGRNPECEMKGNWKRPSGKGRSFTVGLRRSGKYTRIYEKGKQLGDPDSPWTRVEVEFKSVDRLIPFDALTRPGEYLSASYPAFAWINEHQERILTLQKSTEITYEKTCKWLKRQCGAALRAVADIEGSAEAMLEKLRREDLPRFMKIPDWRFSLSGIHASAEIPLPITLDASVHAW